jgi:tRNA splicing endonuclease
MATSSKVQFRLETLKEKALESIDFRIAQQRLLVESFDDDEALEQRITEWRTRQEEKVSDLFRSLGEADNHRLSKFKIDPIPEVDRWERQRAERDLQSMENKRTQILAKSESLVADEDGNIALTKTQLSEFFGL